MSLLNQELDQLQHRMHPELLRHELNCGFHLHGPPPHGLLTVVVMTNGNVVRANAFRLELIVMRVVIVVIILMKEVVVSFVIAFSYSILCWPLLVFTFIITSQSHTLHIVNKPKLI